MRSTCIFLVFLCFSSLALSSKISFEQQISSMLQMHTSATDAIDTVLNLLNDLRNANTKEQEAADALNKTQEAEGRQQIQQLTELRDNNRKVLDNAIEHTKFIEAEILDTVNYLEWIKNRRAAINKKLGELADARCYSNALFVKALKEHRDAIDVIELLKKDLAPYATQTVSLAQINTINDKIKMYAHLFNQDALSSFLSLGREGHEDNDRAAINVATFNSGTDTRNLKASLGDSIIDLLTKLQEHLRVSMKDLEDKEIAAAYDFAEFQSRSEKELASLDSEEVRKKEYLAKLNVDVGVARNFQENAQKQWEDSCKALQAAIDDLNAKRAVYERETSRRNGENAVLDEVITIFKEKVASVAQYLRNRVEDHQNDQTFNETDLKSRKIDQQVAQDANKLAGNVASEAATA